MIAALAVVIGVVAALFIRPLAAQVVAGVIVAAVVFTVFEQRWWREGRRLRKLSHGVAADDDGTVTVDGSVAGQVRRGSDGRWYGDMATGAGLVPCSARWNAVLLVATMYRNDQALGA